MKSLTNRILPPNSPTFASTLGQFVFLMTVSKWHRDLKINVIEDVVTSAIALQHFKLYSKGKQPVVFLAWAMVSEGVKERFEAGNRKLEQTDRRSGSNLIVVECISPFASEKRSLRRYSKSQAKVETR